MVTVDWAVPTEVTILIFVVQKLRYSLRVVPTSDKNNLCLQNNLDIVVTKNILKDLDLPSVIHI